MNFLPKNIDLVKDPTLSGVSLLKLAERYKTPLYVYDWEHLQNNLDTFTQTFGEKTLFRYAAKAFICKAMVKELQEKGWGVDVVSGGEMFTVNQVLKTLKKVLFNGTFKTTKELEYFIDNEGGLISIDNKEELEKVNVISKKKKKKQRIILRLNLDVGAETHPMVLTTGHKQQFGISIGDAEKLMDKVVHYENVVFSGVHVHIGSQIKDPERYYLAMKKASKFLQEHKECLNDTAVFNAGGGFFSPYTEEDTEEHKLEAYRDSINKGIKEFWKQDYKLIIEPGRAVVNNPGVILYTVGAIKEDRGEKPYLLVDGGMSDNPRIGLYGSEHTLFNLSNRSEDRKSFVVSGRHCESGDILSEGAELPKDTKPGDIIMSAATGAYTQAMSSNYNRVPKAAVVSVQRGGERVIIKAQDFKDTAIKDA